VAAGAPPTDVAGPVTVTTGAGDKPLATSQFSNSDGKPHRVLLTGGFNAACTSCTGPVNTSWTLTRSGAASALIMRRLSPFAGSGAETGSSVSEVVVTPDACAPCSFTLNLSATGGSTPQTVTASEIRLAVVDLGPLAP
jgi:hypothetical protein